MAITTISSREFNQNTSAAKKAAEHGPVFITDRGQTAHVLITFEEYLRVTGKGKNIVDMLAMPEDMDICADFDSLIPRSREVSRAADLS
jgi:hypothetical protein